ncbi:hypothetical protein WDU94_006575 [Cyamophila willieti]
MRRRLCLSESCRDAKSSFPEGLNRISCSLLTQRFIVLTTFSKTIFFIHKTFISVVSRKMVEGAMRCLSWD